MDFLLSDDQLSPLNKAKDKEIVQAWLVAIDSFYDYYSQLCIYANTYYAQESMSPPPSPYVGQCSIGQLDNLLDLMQQQLEKLVADLGQTKQAKDQGQWTVEKLLVHTQLLTQLNGQASVVCRLASQPAS